MVFSFAVASTAALSVRAAAENWHVDGRDYSNVRVGEVTSATVTIFHTGGITQLELARLPEALQARFGFDPAQAAAWQVAATSGIAATRDTQRRVEAEKQLRAAERSATVRQAAAAPDVTAGVVLHPTLDLRPLYQKHGLYLKDQGRRPSCSVFAVISALEFAIAERAGRVEPLSEEFLIWAVNQLQPGLPLDDGYHFEEVISALQSYGVPRQTIMPNTFGKKTADISPPPAAMVEAPALRAAIPIWFRPEDPQLLHRVVDALNRGHPVVIGIRWPHARTLAGNHLLRDQQPLEGAGHAVTLIGYQCKDGNPENLVFILRNSYGIHWGLGGYGFVAASYLREHLISAFYLTLPADFSPPFSTLAATR